MANLPGVKIEYAYERCEREWPKFWFQTGEDGAHGRWKHPALWRIYCCVVDRQGIRTWREHLVFAAQAETAVACLMRDLGQEDDWFEIRTVVIYKVRPPLTAPQVRAVEEANTRLRREIADRRAVVLPQEQA